MIFLLCPPRIATGGPESMHLLARELARIGHDARMTYVPADPDGTPADYAGYGVGTAAAVVDAPEHTVIVPEVWTWRLAQLRAVRKVVWWLSVDNYLEARSPFDFGAPVVHLAGSAYARAFVEAQGGRRVAPLSSYVHASFGADAGGERADVGGERADAGGERADAGGERADVGGERADQVAYNPKKGLATVERLMAAAPDLAWTRLEGLSRAGVADALRRAKVYVDFGHHPGKERLPREAAAAGCCVITGMRGSAAFDEDVPIPPAYKFDDRAPLGPAAVAAIADTIRVCVREYAARRADFAPYRAAVRAEQATFEAAVRALFPRPT
jgi:hypothetical protein